MESKDCSVLGLKSSNDSGNFNVDREHTTFCQVFGSGYLLSVEVMAVVWK